MKINANKSGLVMAEALLTVTMLAVVAVVLSGAFRSSLSMTSLSKNYLIGQNLAVEGVEIVKQIRNTNWMIEPNDKGCWLVIDPSSGCDGGTKATTAVGNYVAFKSNNGSYKLVNDSSTTLYIDSVSKQFTSVAQNNNASKFSRAIKFTNITEVGGVETDATIEVTVSWKDGAQTSSVKVTEVITNSL